MKSMGLLGDIARAIARVFEKGVERGAEKLAEKEASKSIGVLVRGFVKDAGEKIVMPFKSIGKVVVERSVGKRVGSLFENFMKVLESRGITAEIEKNIVSKGFSKSTEEFVRRVLSEVERYVLGDESALQRLRVLVENMPKESRETVRKVINEWYRFMRRQSLRTYKKLGAIAGAVGAYLAYLEYENSPQHLREFIRNENKVVKYVESRLEKRGIPRSVARNIARVATEISWYRMPIPPNIRPFVPAWTSIEAWFSQHLSPRIATTIYTILSTSAETVANEILNKIKNVKYRQLVEEIKRYLPFKTPETIPRSHIQSYVKTYMIPVIVNNYFNQNILPKISPLLTNVPTEERQAIIEALRAEFMNMVENKLEDKLTSVSKVTA